MKTTTGERMMTMQTLEDADRAAVNAIIRARLLDSGRKCRLCEVIVQAAQTGSIDDGMTMHKSVVHRIHA
jgi:hypothetical protein